jgi:hypothetical protein
MVVPTPEPASQPDPELTRFRIEKHRVSTSWLAGDSNDANHVLSKLSESGMKGATAVTKE